jgi:hypothetical protein
MPPPGDLHEIARHLAEATIHPLLVERLNGILGEDERRFESLPELLSRLDARLARRLCEEILPSLKILDPACGFGVFLAAALDTLVAVYSAAIAKGGLSPVEGGAPADLPGLLRRRILADNLFGVDLAAEAIVATRCRLLAHAGAGGDASDLDLHLFHGNSLLGLLHVDDGDFERRQPGLFRRTFSQALAEKARRKAGEPEEETRGDRQLLDLILLDEWQGIPYEQATWDRGKNQLGKPVKRPIGLGDVRALRPFHWAYELDPVLGERGGFDVILTDPPWEAVKPQVREFLAESPAALSVGTPKELEREPARLGQSRETREDWLAYLSRFPHLALYFRTSPQYSQPIAAALGRKAGADLHWDELFLARCFRLLRPGGRSGIVLPTSLYADPALKALRESLFSRARVELLFGLSNERSLFAEVERGFRLALLVFARPGETDEVGATESFTADFKIEPRDALPAAGLEDFWHGEHLRWSWSLVQRLSPGSLVVPEDLRQIDLDVLQKAFRFPALGSEGAETWDLRLDRGFDSKNDSYLFRNAPGPHRLPLYEGRMIGPFAAEEGAPRYWLEEDEARRALLGRKADTGQTLAYQGYRLGFRDGARNEDERPLVLAMLPPGVFSNDKLSTVAGIDLRSALFLCAVLNSFVVGYLLRQRNIPSVTFSVFSQIPVPRPEGTAKEFSSLVELAARRICRTPEFTALWESALGTFWFPPPAATDPAERTRLAAEIEGRMAHLYGLTEEELAHILATFPAIEEEVRVATLGAYRALT